MIQTQLIDEEATLAFGLRLASALPSSQGAIIFLNGALGAGKTTFTRGVLRGLGYHAKVKSPTYTLVEPYQINEHAFYHFDLYRLSSPDELMQIGIEEYLTPPAICLIEWPEKGFPHLPTPDLIIHFHFHGLGRTVEIDAKTTIGENIIKQLV